MLSAAGSTPAALTECPPRNQRDGEPMIGKDQISEAVRCNDALAEENLDFEAFWEAQDVSIRDLTYVAHQRALRAAMVYDGQDPRAMSRTHPTPVNLSPEALALIPTLVAAWVDGFAAGLRLNPNERTGV